MAAITADVCICSVNHGLPISECEILDALDYEWEAGHIQVSSSLEDIKRIGDFFEFHLTADVLTRWAQATAQDACMYGRHHRWPDCTTDCAEDVA